MILLTGAIGRVGSATAKALARASLPFRGLVRDPDKVAFDADVAEIVVGDLSDPTIVEQALEGVSCVAQSPEAFREVLGQFIQSAWQLDAVCELFAEIAAGSLEEQTATTAELLGRPAMDLKIFTQQFDVRFSLRVREWRCLQCG